MFACTKKCHAEICKAYKVSDDQMNHDGKDGDDDPNNLENILIEWLTSEGTIPDSIMERQAQEVQGRRMYVTKLLI